MLNIRTISLKLHCILRMGLGVEIIKLSYTTYHKLQRIYILRQIKDRTIKFCIQKDFEMLLMTSL